ncbi:FAD-binding domain-containing protein [uncultured Roseobacter sp.]|uniref:FAD-binding domain-containing protein n=1 Tax=uncultured Roseobacter sp. TaxID=114847 RepID=UPI00262FC5B4|nr:FAD-binding domain-containing protein [uncultured Roseobacter sp.]
MTALDLFPPTRTAALERLQDFLPCAGRDYAARRNYDLGPGRHHGVSTLSPYLRCRLITEEEVLSSVRGRHSAQAAEKFIQEVYWRTYWKGWLELRPAVWAQYQHDLRRLWDDVQTQSGLRDRWEEACKGETGVDCFDAWAEELVHTGYLHNHARMWFASIWIFTLELPWELGADFFLRHLLDGDPASNTLSWRWVAGIQTQGKTYLARADNIAKYTDGRFDARGRLASVAEPRVAPPPPAPGLLPQETPPKQGARTGLLLHPDDLSPGFVLDRVEVAATGLIAAATDIGPLTSAPHAAAFREAAQQDAAGRWSERLGEITPDLRTAAQIANWATAAGLEQIVTPYAPVGPTADLLAEAGRQPEVPPLHQIRRSYDRAAWPHATKGFFPFKKKIPALLSRIG